MAIETVRTTRTSFDLKSASLPVVAVVLKTTDTAVLTAELALRMADAPGFFDNDPVLIDLGPVREADSPLDFPAIMALLRSHRTMPVAVRGGNTAQMQAALAAGLTAAPEAGPVRTERRAPVASAPVPAPAPGPQEQPSQDLSEPPVVGLHTVVIDKPLRSGQQVYARGADLVVLAMVSFGAEVIADGNIHVYAPLRGRAMAGARGNIHARIFTTCMEPQLVSIAGIYRTTEVAIPVEILGQPAQVRLDGEKLLIERL
ncbi:septum site-determining protein MinC [Simplicispira psychrophila]|uniref:septum site-determining protein MinC n=1 Tax=Simplicispira psychrophila TaxID=80882 RepID=UPI0004821427|nr:septum site-determining protein MinC [Simplicispira psychrophila]